MALIECIDCRSKVSDLATDCPRCGCPVAASLAAASGAAPPAPEQAGPAADAEPAAPEPEAGQAAAEAPAPAPAGPASRPACAPGELCHFGNYSELAALLGAGKTHAVVRGEKTRWTWQGVVLGGIVGTVIAFLWAAVAHRLGIPKLDQIIGAVTLLLSPLLLYLRWHRPRDYMIVHDDRISFVRQVKFERGVGVGERGDSMPLGDVERVVYRTSFWKKWLTLVCRNGERISFTHGLINRRRRMPGVEAVRMRTAADLLGYLGVPHRFNYALAIVTPIFVIIWGVVANFDYSRFSAEAAAASAAPARYEVMRATNVRDGPSPRDMIRGRLPAGATVEGVAIENGSGEVWIRIASGPHAGAWLWGANIRAAPNTAALAAADTNMAQAAAPPAAATGNMGADMGIDMATNMLGNVSAAPPPPPLAAPASITLAHRLLGRWVPQGEPCSRVGIAFEAGGAFRTENDIGQWWLTGSHLTLQYMRNGRRTIERFLVAAVEDYGLTLREAAGDLNLQRCGR